MASEPVSFEDRQAWHEALISGECWATTSSESENAAATVQEPSTAQGGPTSVEIGRAEREALLAAVRRKDWNFVMSASEELRGNREIMLQALDMTALAIEYATTDLRDDRGLVMKALAKNGLALQFASSRLRGDREVLLRAVSSNWWAVSFACEELRNDESIMRTALALSKPPNRPQAGVQARALRVSLLSGRTTTEYFHIGNSMSHVLNRCAVSLGLDPTLVSRTGKLVSGTQIIKSIREMSPSSFNNLTLVLS